MICKQVDIDITLISWSQIVDSRLKASLEHTPASLQQTSPLEVHRDSPWIEVTKDQLRLTFAKLTYGMGDPG